MKKPRFSYRSEGTDDVWNYVGTLEEAKAVVAGMVEADLDTLEDGESMMIEVRREDMTEEEVAAIPEL